MNLRSAVILKLLSVLSVRNVYPDLTGALGIPRHVAPSTPAMRPSAQTSPFGKTHPAMLTMENTLGIFVEGTLVSVTSPGMPDMMAILRICLRNPQRCCHTSVETNQTKFSL